MSDDSLVSEIIDGFTSLIFAMTVGAGTQFLIAFVLTNNFSYALNLGMLCWAAGILVLFYFCFPLSFIATDSYLNSFNNLAAQLHVPHSAHTALFYGAHYLIGALLNIIMICVIIYIIYKILKFIKSPSSSWDDLMSLGNS